MPDAPQIEELRAVLERIERTCRPHMRYHNSWLHGLGHLREVALLAGRIAAMEGLDVEAAMVGGYLHDCGREDDAAGNSHAIVSARLAREIMAAAFAHLDAGRICRAIERHADGLVTPDPLEGAIWDADRLTLPRAGHVVKLELLSTSAGRLLAGQARQNNR